ncbi:Strongly-conserved Zn-finger binding protein (TFIIIA) [Ascosphaera aggregata]|nr:Strongly-conserved Zn-finger binding protein (TFIIIA) [Ascosphaera aggregata]
MILTKRKAALMANTQRKRLQSSYDHTAAGVDTTHLVVSSSSPAPSNDPDYPEEPFGDSEEQSAVTSVSTPVSPSVVDSVKPVKSKTRSKYPSDRKIHRCPFENCEKAFNRPARLQEHLRSHNNERIFHCPHEGCDKSFIRASHLNHHVKSAHTTIREYVCPRPGCGKSFVTGTRLRRHMTAHEGRDKYRCTGYKGCNETFRKHSTLQRHIMSAHLGLKPFPCDKCDAGFETAGHLRVHVARMHGDPRFTCAECSAAAASAGGHASGAGVATVSFPTYALLQSHIRTAHPPVCVTCGHVCTTARELRRHIDVTHGTSSSNGCMEGGSQDGTQIKEEFRCPLASCGRTFSKRGNLNVHIRTVHEGEKRFVCGETDLSKSKKVEGYDMALHGCGKRYGSKLALEEHIRTAHLGLKSAKAGRREKHMDQSRRVGASDSAAAAEETVTSNAANAEINRDVALLTGADLAASGKSVGRHIPCLLSNCLYRFHRDYDLYVHMGARHGLGEGVIQWLFMRRAMSGAYESFDLDTEGLPFQESNQLYGTGDDGFGGNLETAPDLSLNLFDDLQLAPSLDPGVAHEQFLSQPAIVDSNNMKLFDDIPESLGGSGTTALVDPGLT